MQRLKARQALTGQGWQRDVEITIDAAGRIASITKADGPGPWLDAVLPAPVNLHSHAFQRAMAGLTETRGPDPSDSFWTWRRLMYRFLDRLTPDHVEAIATLVFMEMLEAGYAGVAEFHYLHHQPRGLAYDDIAEMGARIVAAAGATGIGLTHLPVLYTHGGCDGRALAGGQQRFGNDIDRYARLLDASRDLVAGYGASDYRVGVAPHSLRAVDPEGLARAVALGAGGPIHMHLAEQIPEVDEVLAHHGVRPVEWLLANHEVTRDWTLIHCTQMTAAETRALAGTGAVAGLCPITESSLGDGIFNGVDFVAADGCIGFGSDSNIHIALWEELATLDYSQRLRDHSRAALARHDHSTGRVLFDHVTRFGAQAAGRDSGVIAPGCWADLMVVDTDNPWLCGREGDTLLDSLIFTGRGRDCVTDVFSAGRHVVREGRHVARDAVVRNYKKVVAELGQEIG
jgi:formimidoylglutamate deiminase